MKIYLMREIAAKLKEAGIPSTKPTLLKWEYQGKLKLRRFPHNNWRYATEKDIEEIIKAFSVNGGGRWTYAKNK